MRREYAGLSSRVTSYVSSVIITTREWGCAQPIYGQENKRHGDHITWSWTPGKVELRARPASVQCGTPSCTSSQAQRVTTDFLPYKVTCLDCSRECVEGLSAIVCLLKHLCYVTLNVSLEAVEQKDFFEKPHL